LSWTYLQKSAQHKKSREQMHPVLKGNQCHQ